MIPQLVSHYRILENLGKGGMGEVYLAEDLKLIRKVAIKFLSSSGTLEEMARKRFIREAQTAAILDHPNICAVYEVGEEAGHDFIVMQYVDGVTLDCKYRQRPPALQEVLDIAAQIVSAIAEAHSHGIIHRDIKPQNIMLTARGQVKVLDFGLAKVVASLQPAVEGLETQSLLSEPGLLIGTMPYMSPEHLRGEELDHRSDIFSVGTILYELVSGTQPFARPTPVATVSAILTYDPPPPTSPGFNVPPDLERIIFKCLEKNREKRYQSALELLRDLESLRGSLHSGASTLKGPAGKRRLVLRAAIAALAAGLLLSAGAMLYRVRPSRDVAADGTDFRRVEGAATTSPASLDSIAVMPFVIESDSPDADVFSKGCTDNLIAGLSHLPGLRVIAYSSVARYAKTVIDPRKVGRELNVKVVLVGKFAQRGDSLSITVELLETQNSTPLWSKSYGGTAADILSVQRDITRDLLDKLVVNLKSTPAAGSADQHTDNREAYKLYLMGRNAWGKRTPGDLKRSIELFQQAIDLDPTYALAYAGLSDSYSSLGIGLQVIPPKEAMPKARAAALRALEFDESLAEAHTSLAIVEMLYDWDWQAAETHFKRAIELNPNSATAHNWYAYFLIAMGRFEESDAESRRCKELDPLSTFFDLSTARTDYFARRYDQAIEQCQKVIELNPKFYWAHYLLGLAYVKKGEPEKAITAFKTVVALNEENPLWTAALGYAYARAGNRAAALRHVDDLKRQAALRYVPPINFATIYAGLGDPDGAYEWFQKSYEQRIGIVIFLKVEPAYEDLLADPRFAGLLRQMGL